MPSDGGTPIIQPWHRLTVTEVLAALGTDGDAGLDAEEARRRLRRVGPNRVGDEPETPLWRILLSQFRGVVVLLLLAASVVAFTLGERAEALAILAALLINAGIGFASEWRARISLARLRALVVPFALTRRGGTVIRIAAADLVPGDLVSLEPGAQVPADARLVRSAALMLAEAALTGESAPVQKQAEAQLHEATPLAERHNMVYLGSAVLTGSGLAVVTSTGVATELGRIGQLVALAGERETPLEKQMERLGRRLIVLALGICGLVGIAGVLQGEPIGLMIETAISLAVAAVPEGLPAVTTLALAAGLWRLARAGALVRRLPAVETLGSTTVICVDKTGTLTENQMTTVRIFFQNRFVTVTGGGRSLEGQFLEQGVALDPLAESGLRRILETSVLVNDASIQAPGPGTEELLLHGDQTDAALLLAARKAGIDPDHFRQDWPRLSEIPFEPRSRYMASIHRGPDGRRTLLVKGAPEVILAMSATCNDASGDIVLDDELRQQILDANQTMAGEGLRVLAAGWRRVESDVVESGAIHGLSFLGLVGLTDPPRPGVKDAIALCRQAGIRPIMLTGDQRPTAEAIGRLLGIDPESVHSRVTPEGKMALVTSLQSAGEVVAMTGDGVNDAPALARADIGVAMGRTGTDVAREAADLVLTDDNFSTIVRAMHEGRAIYENLRKVIHFLFSCNLSEIVTIFVAIMAGFPSPLLPLQILWVNLVTDILPALALIRDPAAPDLMQRPPRSKAAALVTWGFGARMLFEGSLLAAGVLSAFFWEAHAKGPGARASTLAFVALVIIHPLQAMNCRSDRVGWWRLPSNPMVLVSLLALLGLQWLATSWQPLTRLLGTVSLSAGDWLLVLVAVTWPVVVLEALKWMRVYRSTDATSAT